MNSILKSNRRILEKLLDTDAPHVQLPRTELLDKGFQLNYLTNMVSSSKGSRYFFCYEYGVTLKGEDVLIVKRPRSDDKNELHI